MNTTSNFADATSVTTLLNGETASTTGSLQETSKEQTTTQGSAYTRTDSTSIILSPSTATETVSKATMPVTNETATSGETTTEVLNEMSKWTTKSEASFEAGVTENNNSTIMASPAVSTTDIMPINTISAANATSTPDTASATSASPQLPSFMPNTTTRLDTTNAVNITTTVHNITFTESSNVVTEANESSSTDMQHTNVPQTTVTLLTSKSRITTNSTPYVLETTTNSTQLLLSTQPAENLILDLPVWQFSLIVGACGLVLLVLLLLLVFCLIKKRQEYMLEKENQERQDMWTTGTGGVEITMVNITANNQWRKSTDSIDETITTAVVVEPTTTNVFGSNQQGYLDSPNLSHLSKKSRSSVRSSSSMKSSSSAASVQAKNKPQRTLTKVATPTIGSTASTQLPKTSDLKSTSSKDGLEKSDAESESSYKVIKKQRMSTFTSSESILSKTASDPGIPPSGNDISSKHSVDGTTESELTLPPPPPPPGVLEAPESNKSGMSIPPPPPPPPPPGVLEAPKSNKSGMSIPPPPPPPPSM